MYCATMIFITFVSQDISCTLKNSEQKVVALKKCAQNLRQILPTVEAEVHTQEKLFHVVEKVERYLNCINYYYVQLYLPHS